MIINETFFPRLSVVDDDPLKIHLAGITHKDPNYGIYRSGVQDVYILEYVTAGRGHVHYGDNYFSPQAGDVYFLQPNVEHRYYSDENDPWEKIWFNVSGELVNSLCDTYKLNGAVYYPDCPLKDEFFKMASLLSNNSKADIYSEICIQFHRIIAGLYKWCGRQSDFDKTDDGIILKKYLDTHWHSNITLAGLAGYIHRSIPHTIRIFENDWGVSPYQYLLEKRLFYACQYLENTDYTVKMLAGLVGFNDEFYFSNWFKKHKGLSPLFYRRQFRQRRKS